MITVLVPAHNEEKGIANTIKSLLNQTLAPTNIVIIADNCTDKTVEIASKYDVEVLETISNKGKKAGALNQAFATTNLEEYVLIMDADTVLDNKAIEEGIKTMKSDNKIGAVCSRAGVLNHEGKGKLLWGLQHIEYGLFDSSRVETQGNIKVAHGMCTMYRTKAIRSVVEFRKDNFNIDSGIFLEDNLVEDYELTLCLKHSWKISTSLTMLAYTDVPVKLRELSIQRLRWLRGGIDTLRSHKWNKVTAPEILNHCLFILLIFLRVFALVVTFRFLKINGFQGINKLVLTVVLLAFTDSFYRLKYVQDKTILDYIIKFSIVPEILYNWLQAGILVFSYILSFGNIEQKW